MNRKKIYFKRLLNTIGFLSFVTVIIFAMQYVQPKEIIAETKEPEIVYIPDSTKTMEKFLEDLGQVESRNNYKISNQYGYMGKYQIGMTALKQIGLGSVSREQFLDNPELQEAAMKMLLKENKKVLSNYIGKYQSKVIKGVYITESGILAAAQMAPAGTIKFLTSKGDSIFKDGNGVPIIKYLKQFSGYNIKLN